MSGDHFTAETEIGRSITKLAAIADMFMLMSGQEGSELNPDSFYGISLLIKQETDAIKKDTDMLITHIRNHTA
jgi:hypothetical protein